MSAVCPLCGGTIREALRWVRLPRAAGGACVVYQALTPSYHVAGLVVSGPCGFESYGERSRLLDTHRTLRAAKRKVAHLAHNLAAMRADTRRRNAQ